MSAWSHSAIKIRWTGHGKYADVVFPADDFVLLNEQERKDLADHLREIADKLSPATQED